MRAMFREMIVDKEHCRLEYYLMSGRAAGFIVIKGASSTEFMSEYESGHWELRDRLARAVARVMLRKLGLRRNKIKKADLFPHEEPDTLVLDFRLREIALPEALELGSKMKELADKVRDPEEGKKFVDESFNVIKGGRG